MTPVPPFAPTTVRAPSGRGLRRTPTEAPDVGVGPRSARSKLVRLIVVTLVTLTVLVGVSAAGLGLLHHRVTLLADELGPETAANTAVRISMLDAQTAMRGFVLTGEPEFLVTLRTHDEQVRRDLGAVDALASDDPALATLAAAQRSAATDWLDVYGRGVTAGTIGADDAVALEAARESFETFRVANDAVATDLRQRTEAVVADSRRLTEAAIALILVVGVGGKAMVIRPGLRALRFIGPPLEALHATVRALRGGDLDARADSTEGVVEIRAVAAAVNELADTNQRQRTYLDWQLRMAEAVRQVGLRIGHSLDLGTVIDTAAEAIAAHFPCSVVWVRAFEGEGELPGRGRGATFPRRSGPTVPDPLLGVCRRVAYLAFERQSYALIGRRHPRMVDFVSEEEQTALLDAALAFGADALLVVPVGSGPECLGYLILGRSAGQPGWHSTESAALGQVGRDVGRAILHARIFEREQELVSELQTLDVKKRDFVSMVSHELRTPLASIIGHLEIIRSGDLGEVPGDMSSSLSAMDRNSARLSRLIEDLLLISRIEEGVQPSRRQCVDAAELAREAAQLQTAAAAQRHVTVVTEIDRPAPATGDGEELLQVLNNLISNAIKFSPDGSTVRVSVDSDPTGTTITVRDQGLGISPADQEELFTRFFRSSNPAAHLVPGTGLGLTIAKLIIGKHQGSISVESSLGHGSTFTVRLPPGDLATPVPVRTVPDP